MKLLNSILYLEFSEAIKSGISENTLKQASQRNSPSWSMITDPVDKRKVLIEFEKMRPQYKDLVQKRFGNVYDYVAKEPIRKMVVKDLEAEKFYLAYRYDDNKFLPIENVNNYVAAASWLNMLVKAEANKKDIKKLLNLCLADFWIAVCEIIKTDNIDLPSTYQRLRQKIQEFSTNSYASLIHKQFGNNNAKKVSDELAESVLLELIAHPNQYDDVFICLNYNTWATKNNYQSINPSTVGVWRRKKGAEITISRYGNAAFNEKFIRQVKGFKPTRPTMLWESDDYNLNYYYADLNSETNKEMQRYVSYIVADSKTGLILGKSYRQAKSPVVEMVRLAYIDAMYYVRRLTGAWHIPSEIKTDHWQEKTLKPFFESIGKYVPAAHANKHRGYIEQLFGSPHAKRCEKMAAHKTLNYNGNNITAINRGVNLETLHLNRKDRPHVGAAADNQVEKFFWLMQNLPSATRENMDAPSREKEWLQDWNNLTDEQKRPISDEQFLLMFGYRHQPQGRTIAITNRGVEPQIDGVKYSYDLPNYVDSLKLIDEQVTVIYDPYDMSRVLVTNDRDIRFIAHSAILHPRALGDVFANSRTALNMVLSEKKEQVQLTGAKQNKRLQAIGNNGYDEEAILLGHFMPKELKNVIEDQSERAMLHNKNGSDEWQSQQEQFLNENYDFDSFIQQP